MDRLCRVWARTYRSSLLTYSDSRLENTAGTGFNPRNSGTNATNVPQEAVIVEDTDSSIQYLPQYQWSVNHNIQYHGPNLSGTKQNGTSLTFTFEGVAVW